MIDASVSIPMTEQVNKAKLFRVGHKPITLTQGSDLRLNTPQGTPAGVYRLEVTTACGCFSSNVYVGCSAPAVKATHPDLTQPLQVECCP